MAANDKLSEPIPGGALATEETPQLQPEPPEAASLSNRVAVITGGGWNIGRATSLALARAGAKVVITSRNRTNLEETVALAKAEDLEMRCIQADLTDDEQVERVFEDVAGAEGEADILCAIAGGYGAAQAVTEGDAKEWLDVLLRNLYATYLCCRAALPPMLSKKRGDILTFAGGGAFFPMVGTHATAYASAKAGICRFTDQLYAEHMEVQGLRINCVEPGMTLSPLDLAQIEAEERRTGQKHPAREHNHPPEAGAELVEFLLSPAARAINGRILSVDDDWWRDPERVQAVAQTDLYRLRRNFLTD